MFFLYIAKQQVVAPLSQQRNDSTFSSLDDKITTLSGGYAFRLTGCQWSPDQDTGLRANELSPLGQRLCLCSFARKGGSRAAWQNASPQAAN